MEIKINRRIGQSQVFVFSKNAETGLYHYSRPIYPNETKEIEDGMTQTVIDKYKEGVGLGYEEVTPGGSPNPGVVYGLNELKAGNTLQAILANQILVTSSQGKCRFANVDEKVTLFKNKVVDTLYNYGICLQGPPYDGSDGGYNDFLLSNLYNDKKLMSYSFPIILSLSSMGLGLTSGDKPNWVRTTKSWIKPTFESEEGMIYGKNAINVLEEIIHKCNIRNKGADTLHWGFVTPYGGAFGQINGPYGHGPDISRLVTSGNIDDVHKATNQYIKEFNSNRKEAEVRLKKSQTTEREAVSAIDKDISSLKHLE